MVCIAAFIILAIVGIFVAFLSIFKRDIGRKYWKVFKKSTSCFTKHITFQKCDTNFKDDVKNSLLRKVVIKHPKAVKPLSVTIEVVSVLIVLVTVWSLVEGVKAGMALWTLGSCNVRQPSACSLSSEACSIDSGNEASNPIEAIGLWFADWGEIFGALPDRFRSWDTEQFDLTGVDMSYMAPSNAPTAIDIFDPGCEVCAQSFENQVNSNFFNRYKVKLVVFPIQNEKGQFKFENSEIVSRYILAVNEYGNPSEVTDSNALPAGYKIISRIFLEKNHENKSYQYLFNNVYTHDEAEEKLQSWLKEFGYSKAEISEISERAHSEDISNVITKNNDIVVNNIHAKGIPTSIYDNRKHTGRYEK